MKPSSGTLRTPTLIGILIALGWPLLFFWQGPESLLNVRQDIGIIVKEWGFTLVILAIVYFWERRTVASLGLRMPTWRDIGCMALIGVATVVVTGITAALTIRGPHAALDPRQLAAIPLGLRIALTLTAGICEETLYRGFATERLIEILPKRWMAGLIVVIAFGLAHMLRYGFGPSLLVPTVTGAMITLLYLWRRNLPVCILLHVLLDGAALVVAPAVVH